MGPCVLDEELLPAILRRKRRIQTSLRPGFHLKYTDHPCIPEVGGYIALVDAQEDSQQPVGVGERKS